MSETIVVVSQEPKDNISVNINPSTEAIDVIVQTLEAPEVTVTVSNEQGPQGPQGSPGLVPVFTRQNDLSVVTGKTRFYFEATRTINSIRASVGTVPTGSGVVVETFINQVSIGSVTIPSGQNTAVLTVNKVVNSGDYATVSITSVGSTTPGTDLTLALNIN